MTNITIRKLLYTLAAMIIVAPGVKADLVVVVNDSNSVSNLSMSQLKRIYQGKTTVYESGDEIVLAEFAPENEAFYRLVLNKSTRKLRKLWMKLVFSGGHATPPKVFKKIEKVRQFVRETEGAICFIESSEAEPHMKVLSINGKKPGEDGYPLRTSLPTEISGLSPEKR